MSEFFNVLPPDEARNLLFSHLTTVLPAETMPTIEALGRITAVSILAPHPLPSFRRSTMDGFAVRAADTFGASDSLPAFLQVVGEVPMGEASIIELATGESALVHTGGMIPPSANAVVQVEHTQRIGHDPEDEAVFEPHSIEVLRGVAEGQNVLQVGEDVAEQSKMLPAGHLLRPQDVGGLLALGIVEVAVVRQPRVAIIATGDEVVHPAQPVQAGQIRDINSYTVAARVQQAGGIPLVQGIVPDDLAALKAAAKRALAESDMLVMSAGSSVSVRDVTVAVMESLGEPGVLLHGVATRPGKPTIVGVANGKPLLGLPGNPVSAMVQFEMFGVPTIYWLQRLMTPPRVGNTWAKLAQNIASESGREDYVPVRLEGNEGNLTAVPVFGKSNLIFTLVRAHGLLKVPLNKAGLLAGEMVQVQLY